jgi:hypothetical protein
MGFIQSVVAKTPYNKALKFALAAMEKVSGETKAHSFTGASAAKGYSFRVQFRNVLSAGNVMCNFVEKEHLIESF